jgi:hypothetical protein
MQNLVYGRVKRIGFKGPVDVFREVIVALYSLLQNAERIPDMCFYNVTAGI